MKQYDALIIGSGQAGTPLAKKLAKAGWKTALIEKRFIGGTCVNDGCTPTKTIIASARAAYMASTHAASLGVAIPAYSIDFKKIMQRKDDIVNHARRGSEKALLQTENLDVIYGEAVFTGIRTVEVSLNGGGLEELGAGYIFIDTGTMPKIPDLPGLEGLPFLTSTSILELERVPEHLIILGGGYVGLEFGQLFRRLGSQVTIIDSAKMFLPKEDRDIARAVEQILREDGIRLFTRAKALSAARSGEKLSILFEHEQQQHTAGGDQLLIAAGRIPRTGRLRPENSGIELDDKGYIKTNEKLETNVPGIYALGEANGGPAFTHIAYNDYIIVCRNILDQENRSVRDRQTPYCMFTDPQLARVGLTEKQATEQGYSIQVAVLPMKHTARGSETGETRGLMKAVVDARTQKILGAAILAAEGGETMSVLQMAIEAGFTQLQLRDYVFAHPTFSESINNLFMTLDTGS